MGIKYDYVDVDLLGSAEQDKVMKELLLVNPQGCFPTMVINKTKTIGGFQPEAIKDALA
ncbi:MAG: hypothetical protein LBS61_01735 [Endomicrobium sp.]|jgi:glutaredoxin|nr:hypothetical protein [Endomicrobium sp.]